MNEKLAKRLRKEVGYKKNITTQPAGQYNITIGTGAATRVVSVERFEQVEATPEQKELKNKYKTLKRSV